MTNEDAIKVLQVEMACVRRSCVRHECAVCDLVMCEKDVLMAYQMAVDALQTDGDCISRQAAIDATWENPSYTDPMNVLTEVRDRIKALPSVQQEPLSDAYMKAVWTWLLNYQIKVAELKGRYTPYEVLSWVANDWRKEHE